MKISVIIPVYNAEPFVRRAVESALSQRECGEVILIEDKSPDNALQECKKLTQEHENVYLFQHPNNENRGPGPSRNLGVLKANYDLIAFLDADDIYLPNRFSKSHKKLVDDENIDGVYEPVNCTFQDKESENRYFVSHSRLEAMVTRDVPPEKLFECLMSGEYGYIHLNGLLLRKQAFIDVGMLPELRLHEDTSLIVKLALTKRLVAGERNKPVSTRHLHLNNTFTDPNNNFSESRYIYYKEIINWMRERRVDKVKEKFIKIKFYRVSYYYFRSRKNISKSFIYFLFWKVADLIHP